MTKDDKDGLPVLVCRVKGKDGRFFGKFKDPDETEPSKRWKRIPGGPFSPEVDNEEKGDAAEAGTSRVPDRDGTRGCL
ncbi:hypothetical protein, partial [Escherichia coli]|uniref:hypothetical protein n=1 Tax=Escherichia coli TaxID=562 RepID=UPI001BE4B4C5